MPGQENTSEEWDAVAREREDPDAPPATPAVEEQAAPQGETPQPDPTPEQQYAALSPDVQARLQRLDELAAVMPQLVTELKETRGRVGALQSQWAKHQQAVQPSQTQVAAAAKDPEKWAALKETFPEWGEAISAFVEARLGSLSKAPAGPTAEEIEALVAQRTEASTEKLQKTFNEAIVAFKHPNWKQDIKTPEFGAWFQGQELGVQALARSTDSADAIRMLDLFAGHQAKSVSDVRDERQQRLEAAASTNKPASSGAVSKSFEDMTPKERWDFVARQRKKEAA